MMDRLYISTITDGLTPRYRAEAQMHMGAEEWVPREMLDAALAAEAKYRRKNHALIEALTHMQWCRYCAEGDWSDCDGGRAALAALPAPHGDQGEERG